LDIGTEETAFRHQSSQSRPGPKTAGRLFSESGSFHHSQLIILNSATGLTEYRKVQYSGIENNSPYCYSATGHEQHEHHEQETGHEKGHGHRNGLRHLQINYLTMQDYAKLKKKL
jgi:hypothetical protein